MGLSGCSHATGNTQLSSGHRVPTIRVIHIDAPRIVRTDVANFRSVVQLLTGNESSEGRGSAVYEPVDENLIQRSSQGVIRAIKGCEIPQFHHHHQERVWAKPDYCYYKENSPGLLANEGYFCMWGENEKRLHMGGQQLSVMQDRFSEQDIIAGLISGEPLPDITMLPPLV